jgi:hypothetical protein
MKKDLSANDTYIGKTEFELLLKHEVMVAQ